MSDTIEIGGEPLGLREVFKVAGGTRVSLAKGVQARVEAARQVVETRMAYDEPVYGVTTGFGALAEVKIAPEQIAQLQRNLILSHAAGVGNNLSRRETRAMMLLRAQTLAAGHSGTRLLILNRIIDMLNYGIHPYIPEKGSVGASGDLAPLAHLALGIIGEGKVEYEGETHTAREALSKTKLEAITLEAKEGLALVNGTQAMTAVGGLVIFEALRLCRLADIAGSMTLEGLYGLTAPFDARIHRARPHQGQIECAENIRKITQEASIWSEPNDSKVQDPYSLRCIPQVHGATRDAFRHIEGVFQCEINSATDNPLVFADEDVILSGGNFHGQPLALTLDYAAIALAEIGNISERRVEQLVNPALSGLPPFLVPESGIHSGYMIAQVTAAALVNENKVYATPASIDSIPGSASREDHVSMGMTSARKLREISKNVQAILAVEILCAAQAIDLRSPKRLGRGTQAAYEKVREVVPFLEVDRVVAVDIEAILALEGNDDIVASVEKEVGSLA
jgi:histidine ammonia-lyase